MNIENDKSLTTLNSLKVDIKAKYFAIAETIEDIIEILKDKDKFKKIFILGEGCNTFFTKDYDGLVIKSDIKGKELIQKDGHDVLKVGSGENWHELVEYFVNNGWYGIENLALIPGSVGGAAVINIAAYGQSFSDIFNSLDAIEIETGKLKNFTKDECKLGYRESIFKNELKDKYIVTHVYFDLKDNLSINTDYWSYKHGTIQVELAKIAKEPYTIKDIFNAVVNLRKSKFPNLTQIGCAGSFYKNVKLNIKDLKEIRKIVPTAQYYPDGNLKYTPNTPLEDIPEDIIVKVATGQLIDEGLHYKGMFIGNVGLHEDHALLVVTKDIVKPDELLKFVNKLEKDFYDMFKIKLEREVIFV